MVAIFEDKVPMREPQAQAVPSTTTDSMRAFYAAFALSTVLHIAVLLVFALFFVPDAPRTPIPDNSLVLAEVEPVRLQEQTPLQRRPKSTRDPRSGSSPATSIFVMQQPVKIAAVTEPTHSVPIASLLRNNGEPVSGLAEKVAVADGTGNGGNPGLGSGTGSGGGGGAAAGSGFFGLKTDSKSVVYVVDCSSSMNQKHDSKWKTRFRRLQFELLKSIGGMTADQRFYIIFFNDEMIRMPARDLQPAMPKVKRHFLKWMVKQRALGETDPRDALRYAIRLRPELIYFLTDGAFAYKIQQDLLTIRQSQVTIHTFAFGSRHGEKAMKQIAKQNSGRYHFVP